MFATGGVLSSISSVARLGFVLRAARILHPLPRCGLVLKTAIAAALLAAPAAAQEGTQRATVTVEAERETHIPGFDDMAFALARSGAAADPAVPAAITGIAFASPAGTYAIGEEILVSVTFDMPVTVAPDGAPVLELDIGEAVRRAGYRGGSGTTVLVFAHTVAEGEKDGDGIAIAADRLTAPAGILAGPGGQAVSLTHPAVPPDPNRQVDGVRPTARFLTIDRRTVAIAWDEVLMIDEGLDAPGGFALVVGGVTTPIDAIGLGSRRVSLRLYEAVGDGAWVTLSYTPPEARPVRDLAGNRAAGFAITVTAGERRMCRRRPVAESRSARSGSA